MEKCKLETKIVKVVEDNIDDDAKIVIKEAGQIILDGGLVAFPTETVYGLGGDARNPESSKKIYAAKGRPSDNPLIVHIADIEDLEYVAKDIPQVAYDLADKFWPGPLTMILNKTDNIPLQTTGGLETVAVRMPSHKIAREFIRCAGGFVAAPSANISGRPSPTIAKYVIQDMDGRIDMIIDGDGVEIGLESTIVDLTSDVPMILRPGFITKEMLDKVLGKVEVDKTILDDKSGQAPKAPGMKYRHYAPKGDLVLVEGEPQKVVAYINEQTKLHMAKGEKTGVIGTKENEKLYIADSIKITGSRNEEDKIAHQLYTFLREFDDEKVEFMYAESFGTDGFGQAIMNRLLKAAGHKVVNV